MCITFYYGKFPTYCKDVRFLLKIRSLNKLGKPISREKIVLNHVKLPIIGHF